MKYTLAKYAVQPEKVREIKHAMHEFMAEIRKHEPKTLYLIFRGEDKATFYHLMRFENEAARLRHNQSKYNTHFVKKLYPHCVGHPAFSEVCLYDTSKKQWPLTSQMLRAACS